MNISQWKNGDRTFFSLEVDDRLLLLNSVLNVKALVGAFNKEKALVGAFSVIVQTVVEPMDRFAALVVTVICNHQLCDVCVQALLSPV